MIWESVGVRIFARGLSPTAQRVLAEERARVPRPVPGPMRRRILLRAEQAELWRGRTPRVQSAFAMLSLRTVVVASLMLLFGGLVYAVTHEWRSRFAPVRTTQHYSMKIVAGSAPPVPPVPASPPAAAELRLLREAKAALDARRFREALAFVEHHQLRYPRSFLEEERAALMVFSLAGLSRWQDVRTQQRAFLLRFPHSALTAQMKKLGTAIPAPQHP